MYGDVDDGVVGGVAAADAPAGVAGDAGAGAVALLMTAAGVVLVVVVIIGLMEMPQDV